MMERREEGNYGNGEEVDLTRLVRVLRRYKWLMMGLCAASLLVIGLTALKHRSVFTSAAAIKIDIIALQGMLSDREYAFINYSLVLDNLQIELQKSSWTTGLANRHREVSTLVMKAVDAGESSGTDAVPQAGDLLRRMVKIGTESPNRLLLEMKGNDPAVVRELLGICLKDIHARILDGWERDREKVLEYLSAKRLRMIRHLREESDPRVRENIARIVAATMEREVFVRVAPLDGLLAMTPPSAPAARSMAYLWLRYLAGMFLLLLAAFFLLLLYDEYRETRPAPFRSGPATSL